MMKSLRIESYAVPTGLSQLVAPYPGLTPWAKPFRPLRGLLLLGDI